MAITSWFDPLYGQKFAADAFKYADVASKYGGAAATPFGIAIDVANGTPAGQATFTNLAALAGGLAAAGALATFPAWATAVGVGAAGVGSAYVASKVYTSLPNGFQNTINNAFSAMGRFFVGIFNAIFH